MGNCTGGSNPPLSAKPKQTPPSGGVVYFTEDPMKARFQKGLRENKQNPTGSVLALQESTPEITAGLHTLKLQIKQMRPGRNPRRDHERSEQSIAWQINIFKLFLKSTATKDIFDYFQGKYCNMKSLLHLIILFLFVGCSQPPADIPKIIFDTDLGPDYDDVGALAFLHAMADSGKAEILATVSSNKHELVAPSIDVINTYFNREELPVGAPKTTGASMGSGQHWADSIVAKYPHKIKSTEEVADAVEVYRKILSTQPDKSVTIATVGFLTNLSNLLKSAPDNYSPLNGQELVGKKVKRLVSMAGWFPEGKEFNIYIDSVSSKYALENWPGEIIFTGFEIGSKIFTGLKLIESPVDNSPVKDVFRISIPLSPEDKNGRMSWDETAVLIAVYGTDGFFDTVRGKIIVKSDGSNEWINDPAGRHYFVVQKMPVNEMAEFIEERMMHNPQGK